MIKKCSATIIIPPGVFVDVHEKMTADFLATKICNNVTFLLPERRKGAKTPDIEMANLKWEIKNPTGNSSRTIENNLRNALKQSRNIVLDLRRMDGRIPTKKLITTIEHRFNRERQIERILVITKQESHIDFRRY